MKKLSRAPVIVVTGGMGAGKSTVSDVFKKFNARVLDVDRLARRLLKPGQPAWHEVLKAFCGARYIGHWESGKKFLPGDFVEESGRALPELPWVISSTGPVLRSKLGATIFTDPKFLKILNRIMHPRLRRLLDSRIALHRRLSTRPLILDMAVYPERPFRGLGDVVLWVRAPGGMRAQRLAEHKRLSLEEATARIRAQWTDEEFASLADFILPNLGSDEDLRLGAETLWPRLLAKALGGKTA